MIIINSDIPRTRTEKVVCLFINFLCSRRHILGYLVVDPISVFRHLFMEGITARDCSNLVSLPLRELGFILFNDGHLLHHVLLRQ